MIPTGMEIRRVNDIVTEIIHKDNNDLYFTTADRSLVIRNIKDNINNQIADFFYELGRYPESAATLIRFRDIVTIRIEHTDLFISDGKQTLKMTAVAPSILKKLGIWLKKKPSEKE